VLLKIIQAGNPVLRQAARPLAPKEIGSRNVQELIEYMRETMRDAPGVGLAAPQIGESIQLAVIEDRADLMKELPLEQLRDREREPVPFHVIINPRITARFGPEVEFFEGCLSVSGFAAVVPRHRQVRVECFDEHGSPKVIEATGWYARILQHEIGHLEGQLYVDLMYSRSFTSIENATRLWKNVPVSDVLKQVGR